MKFNTKLPCTPKSQWYTRLKIEWLSDINLYFDCEYYIIAVEA